MRTVEVIPAPAPSPRRQVFRQEAMRAYAEANNRPVLPRFTTPFAIACCWSCLNRLTSAKMPAATLSPRWIASAMAKLDTMRRLLMRQPKNPNTASAARKVNMTDWIQTATKSSCASGAVSSWESDKYTSMEEHWTYSGAQFEYTHTQRQTHRRASPPEKGPVDVHCHQHLLFIRLKMTRTKTPKRTGRQQQNLREWTIFAQQIDG